MQFNPTKNAQRRPGLRRFYLRFLRPGHGGSISPSMHRRQRFRVGGVDAGGMTKPSSANAGSAGRVRQYVEPVRDRKSTRLNSSHPSISYAVFCLKKKKTDRR